MVEEKTVDEGISFNNEHLKYEYNRKGRKTKILRYVKEKEKWIVSGQYIYLKKGNLIIQNDPQTKYDFYDNGLIKRELWESSKSDEVVNFITTYEFYE